jgi:hypothetical protein
MGSVVSIATGCGLDGPGIESWRGRDFLRLSRPALGPTQSPVQWVLVFPRGKEQPGRDADPSPPSSAMVMKEWSSPYGPYGLYRPSVLVQVCTLKLGSMWAVPRLCDVYEKKIVSVSFVALISFGFLDLEGGTGRLSKNVSKDLPLYSV